jgi:hypothetical protein
VPELMAQMDRPRELAGEARQIGRAQCGAALCP